MLCNQSPLLASELVLVAPVVVAGSAVQVAVLAVVEPLIRHPFHWLAWQECHLVAVPAVVRAG